MRSNSANHASGSPAKGSSGARTCTESSGSKPGAASYATNPAAHSPLEADDSAASIAPATSLGRRASMTPTGSTSRNARSAPATRSSKRASITSGVPQPRRALISSITFGTTASASPTIPRSARRKIGASPSLLIAMIRLAPFIPTTCCVAPLMPTAM